MKRYDVLQIGHTCTVHSLFDLQYMDMYVFFIIHNFGSVLVRMRIVHLTIVRPLLR